MAILLRALVIASVLLSGSIRASAQEGTQDAIVAVIERNNALLPDAYWKLDTSRLPEFLTGPELDRRAADIQRAIDEGAQLWSELQDFVVVSVSFPQANTATVDTAETWYEWVELRGVAVERTWTAPERYELWLVDGAW